MGEPVCRACHGVVGAEVLDLGEQPAADHFPAAEDPGPDEVHPLQMWLCASCGLAQLVADPTTPEEPLGTEPAALLAQAADAVGRAAAAGYLPAGGVVAEYESPHGGSWLSLLAERGLTPAAASQPADVVVDSFGMMHAADQSAALAERMARVAPGGVLLLQYHSLDTIARLGQWSALRHGHYAYYSTTALTRMLAAQGWIARRAWCFDLYGGTVLLACAPEGGLDGPDATVDALLHQEARTGVTDPTALAGLQRRADTDIDVLHAWLDGERAAGRTVAGYAAASRAVSLLARAHIDRRLLDAVVDASAAKQGRRMPGTDVPIVGPDYLERRRPGSVLLFVPDLLDEVRAAFPGVEASGGRWVDAERLGS